MKKVGCTTPFGISLDKVCTDGVKAKMASDMYRHGVWNTSCLLPCKHLANFVLTSDTLEKPENGPGMEEELPQWQLGIDFYFKSYLQKSTVKCTYDELDLYAAVGGFMGMFLGASILQTKDLLVFIFKQLNLE